MRPTGSISPPGGGSGLSPLPADPQVVGLYIAACAAEYNTVPNQRAGATRSNSVSIIERRLSALT